MSGPVDFTGSESRSRVSIVAGVVTGAAAFVAGYLLTFLLVVADAGFGGIELGGHLFESVGLLYFNAQFVDTAVTTGLSTETFNGLSGARQSAIPRALWTLVPVAVLVIAGRRAAAGRSSVLGGASVVAGYLPLAALGTVVFRIEELSPETGPALLLAGVAFPVVCGVLGGLLAPSGSQ